jgi:hypothetical protein
VSPSAHSPLGLRLTHALVFLPLAATVLCGSAFEWRHLVQALSRPFHAGAPPGPPLLAGALLAGVGAWRVAVAVVLRHSAPLWASGLILSALCLASMNHGAPVEAERSEARANLAFLEVGRRLHLSMVGGLQQQGEVPRDHAAWVRALAGATARQDRVRDRRFRARPPRALRVASPDALPAEPLVPGQVLVWVSEDGVTFELRLVGFADGAPALLRTPDGAVLVLKGLYNPDLPPASPPLTLLPELP